VGEEGLGERRSDVEDRLWRGAEGGAGGARGAAQAAGGVPVRAAAVRRGDSTLHGFHLARQRAPHRLASDARVDVPQSAALRPPARRHGRRQRHRRGELILLLVFGCVYWTVGVMLVMDVFDRFR
jgi:hypothetical protein